MTMPTFNQPETGSGYEIAQHHGHLVAYLPTEYRTGIVTKFKPEPTDAVAATVICVDCEAEYQSVLAFQAKIISVTRSKIGEIVLGRVGQEATGKGNPAWVLGTFTPADGDRAVAYWNRRQAGKFAQPAAQPAQQQQAYTGPAQNGPGPDFAQQGYGQPSQGAWGAPAQGPDPWQQQPAQQAPPVQQQAAPAQGGPVQQGWAGYDNLAGQQQQPAQQPAAQPAQTDQGAIAALQQQLGAQVV